MFANKVKKVAAIHDLSGMGRVSLTVVIPILSSMGFQVCPLPTAILSNHTQYPDFTFLDLTDEMPRIIAEWKRLEVEFDAIYTGYLGSPRQIQIVSDFIRDFRRKDSLTVIDPVLGDVQKVRYRRHRGPRHGRPRHRLPHLHTGTVPGDAGAGGKLGCDHPQSDGTFLSARPAV